MGRKSYSFAKVINFANTNLIYLWCLLSRIINRKVYFKWKYFMFKLPFKEGGLCTLNLKNNFWKFWATRNLIINFLWKFFTPFFQFKISNICICTNVYVSYHWQFTDRILKLKSVISIVAKINSLTWYQNEIQVWRTRSPFLMCCYWFMSQPHTKNGSYDWIEIAEKDFTSLYQIAFSILRKNINNVIIDNHFLALFLAIKDIRSNLVNIFSLSVHLTI